MSETPNPDRRRFLELACGAGLIFGLGQLGFGQDRSDQLTPFDKARMRMKKVGAEGLAIVIPDGAEAQKKLGKALQALIPIMRPHEDMPAQGRLLLQVVWVCASAKDAKAKPKETVVLLDPSCKRLAGAAIDFSKDPKVVHEQLRVFLEGKGRLEARAKRGLKNPAIKAALEGVRDPKKRWDHLNVLRNTIEAASAAILVQLEAEQDDEIKAHLKSVLTQLYWQRLNQKKGFPYGVNWKVSVVEPEPCPPCGMAAPSMSGREFLKFITR